MTASPFDYISISVFKVHEGLLFLCTKSMNEDILQSVGLLSFNGYNSKNCSKRNYAVVQGRFWVKFSSLITLCS